MIVEQVAASASARGVSRAEVGLAWLLANPVVTAPIVGATRLAHLDDAIKAVELSLSEDEIKQLESPYTPHEVTGISIVRR